MATNVIYARGVHPPLNGVLRDVLASLNGNGPTFAPVVQKLQLALGMVALAFIREAFEEKARGGTDAAGDSWPPLKATTLAYGRRHPGHTPSRENRRPLLTKGQDEQWRRIFGTVYHRTKDKGMAARVAWATVKKAGGKTLLGTYGTDKVDVLRDTGTLYNSLSPGMNGEPSGHPNQIAQLVPGGVIVGTNRKGAAAHHNGAPSRGLPQRRLWPEPSRWPHAWWEEMLLTLRDGIENIFGEAMRG